MPYDVVWMSNLYCTPGISSPIRTRTVDRSSAILWMSHKSRRGRVRVEQEKLQKIAVEREMVKRNFFRKTIIYYNQN